RSGADSTDFYGVRATNRVVWGDDVGRAPMNHYRLNQIYNYYGAVTWVGYSAQQCTRTNIPDATRDRNNMLCFPQYEGGTFGWYHKYVVTSVQTDEPTGGSPSQKWNYTYDTNDSHSSQGDEYAKALWHYDPN